MNLKFRLTGAVAGILLLTVVAAWMLAGHAVMRPLVTALLGERMDVAAYIAGEVERAPDPATRAMELSSDLDLTIVPVTGDPGPGFHGRHERCHGRGLWLEKGPRSSIFVPVTGVGGMDGLQVSFPVDLERPGHRIGVGLAFIGLAVLAGAVLASRWVLRPVDVASKAMARVADGDLAYRVPEGPDAAGRMAATFNRMAQRVEALVRGQRRLMAAISHELRSPLARMRLTAELLRDAAAPEPRIASLEADIAEMDGLVGEILESARLEEGILALALEPVQLFGLVEDALAASGLEGRKATIDLSEDLVVVADRGRLMRVLSNLLSNAGRYTPEGTELKVRASEEMEGSRPMIALVVEDDGPGVPEEALPQLFDPFFRVDPSRSRSTGGLGLGLMLVRQVVEAHEGRVEARNRPGGGLSVFVRLPKDGPASRPSPPAARTPRLEPGSPGPRD
jgi:signal transduction histidine kinase